MVAPYSIIVPVHDEAAILSWTLPHLLKATAPEAELVFVCNGCSDGSAALLRDMLGDHGRVEELEMASKTTALNHGDDVCTVFPRFYLDADVIVPPGCFEVLAKALQDADLVAPRIRFETRHATRCARAMALIWLSLPHAKDAAFHHLVGISRSGRERWHRFPEILGDDIFMEAITPSYKRRIVPEVSIETAIPGTFIGWVRVRARWRRGERQLATMGLTVMRKSGQQSRLLVLLLSPRSALAAMAFVLARLLAEPLSWLPQRRWFTERSSIGVSGLERRSFHDHKH